MSSEILKVVALKELNNTTFGKILKGQEIPKRIYSKINIESFEKSKLIEVTRKEKKATKK